MVEKKPEKEQTDVQNKLPAKNKTQHPLKEDNKIQMLKQVSSIQSNIIAVLRHMTH